MGFGTGDHATTFLCLRHMEDLIQAGSTFKSCLDFGCGSGILGIAAIKRSGAEVDFCDIDKNALNNCLQNLLLNFKERDLSGSGLISRDKFEKEKKYELVFANILEGILIQEKDIILGSLAQTGSLIISGILNNQVDSIINTYSELNVIKIYNKGEWSSIAFTSDFK